MIAPIREKVKPQVPIELLNKLVEMYGGEIEIETVKGEVVVYYVMGELEI